MSGWIQGASALLITFTKFSGKGNRNLFLNVASFITYTVAGEVTKTLSLFWFISLYACLFRLVRTCTAGKLRMLTPPLHPRITT